MEEEAVTRVVPYSGAWVGMSDDKGFMCCNCGDHVGEVAPKCRNCGIALIFSADPITEVEQRDIQIYRLKSSVASNWDFTGELLKRIVALEAGEKPEWPKGYGTGAAQWLQNNGWLRGVKGTEIAAVIEPWSAYGRGGK